VPKLPFPKVNIRPQPAQNILHLGHVDLTSERVARIVQRHAVAIEEEVEVAKLGAVRRGRLHLLNQLLHAESIGHQHGQVAEVVGQARALERAQEDDQGFVGRLFVEVRAGGSFGGRDHRQDARCHLVRVTVQDRVVGVAELGLAGVDDPELMAAASPLRELVERFDVVDVQLAVDEQHAATALDLLEHHLGTGDGFTHTRLAHDPHVPKQVRVGDHHRQTLV